MGIDEYQRQVGKEEGLEQGRKEAREDSSRLFVENLLKDGGFSVEKIASLTNATADFVNKIKNELKIK